MWFLGAVYVCGCVRAVYVCECVGAVYMCGAVYGCGCVCGSGCGVCMGGLCVWGYVVAVYVCGSGCGLWMWGCVGLCMCDVWDCIGQSVCMGEWMCGAVDVGVCGTVYV